MEDMVEVIAVMLIAGGVVTAVALLISTWLLWSEE